ncbi:MAG: hypothetical protein VKK07_00880 [Merismopediaceae bacterium]|nr:hypothetical protein [Merismopediaceae bacterium]
MFKFFTKVSPSIIIALLLSGFSAFLAYKEQYEAAMAGAGVAVAIASSRKETEEIEFNTEDWRTKYLVREKEHEKELLEQYYQGQLHLQAIEHQQELLKQNFEQQSKIKELEFELKLRERELAINPIEVSLLSESRKSMLPEPQESMIQSLPESQTTEPSQNLEANNNES